METLKKIFNIYTLIAISVLLIIGGIAFVLKKQYDILTKQSEIEKSTVQQKQLQNDIIRSQAQYVSKQDLEKFSKDININLDVVKDDLKKLNGNVVGINNFITSSKGYTDTNRGSDGTIPRNDSHTDSTSPTNTANVLCSQCDKYGYLNNTQLLKLEEKFPDINIPFGSASFSAWKDKPWSLTMFPRDYRVTTVIGTDENGRHYTYNKFSIVSNGKPYDVKIAESKFLEEYPEEKFSFWNPRLYMGFDAGFNLGQSNVSLSPGLHIGLMSYGKTKIAPSWSFVQIGFGYDFVNERPNFILTPAAYNIGRKINPLMENTYIAPSISLDTAAKFTVSLGLRVGL